MSTTTDPSVKVQHLSVTPGSDSGKVLSGQENFTEEEKRLLAPYVSNFDKPVFVLLNLPEALKGALFSRYSRSTKTLRQLLLTEFIGDTQSGLEQMVTHDVTSGTNLQEATKKAEAFYQRILDGYGDDSVGELGGAHIACEDVSNIASKVLEDGRIGGSPLEKSTRYVYFNYKVNGDYMFYKEPVLMASPHRELYLETNRMLFDAYSNLMEPVTSFVRGQFPMEEFPFYDIDAKAEVPYKNLSPEKQGRAQKAYNASLRAHACDILRGLLPASANTNVGIFGNGRFFQELLSKMYSHDLTEIRELSRAMHDALDSTIPSFVKRAKSNDYQVETRHGVEKHTRSLMADASIAPAEIVTMLEYDPEGEDKVIAQMLYSVSPYPLAQLRAKVKTLSDTEKAHIVEEYLGRRRHRRDKPGRAMEGTYYLFDICGDYGAYRDLQRHRMLSQERQLLSTLHGYDMPHELVDAGLDTLFRKCMEKADSAYRTIAADFPKEAQYVVPLQYRIRWYFQMNAREVAHLCELRSTPQGHATYRHIAQRMYQEVAKVHPLLAKHMKFMDMNEYHLGRMQSEMRKEEKRAKYGAAA